MHLNFPKKFNKLQIRENVVTIKYRKNTKNFFNLDAKKKKKN